MAVLYSMYLLWQHYCYDYKDYNLGMGDGSAEDPLAYWKSTSESVAFRWNSLNSWILDKKKKWTLEKIFVDHLSEPSYKQILYTDVCLTIVLSTKADLRHRLLIYIQENNLCKYQHSDSTCMWGLYLSVDTVHWTKGS